MKSLDSKIIIYDSNCKVCSSLKDTVLRLTSVPETQVKAYRDLTSELRMKIDPNKFRNAMALIDTTGDVTLYGSEGIAYIFSSQYPVLNTALTIKPLFRFFDLFYKVLAYNRYIIATPKSQIYCDCMPDRVLNFRLSYIILSVLVSLLLTAMFGQSLRHLFPGLAAADAAVQMVLIAGTGWVLQILIALVALREKALDYIGHLGSIMVVGLLILVPWILVSALTRTHAAYLPAASVVVSSLTMLFMHISRVRHLQLSQAWTVSWFLLLQTSAICWVYVFHIN